MKFLISLLLTLLAEMPVVFVLVRYFFKYKNIKTSQILFVGILASALTLPYLWFVLPSFISNRTFYMVLGESLVILTEAIIYFKLLKLKLSDAFIVSLIANIASIILGLLLQM
jgi:hypothetical protein